MMLARKRPSKRSAFNMTPMIDVVLQLIIFFMYTSQFATMNRSPIDLPIEAGEPEDVVETTALVVDIDAGGQIIAERERISDEAFFRKVLAEVQGGGANEFDLLIRADRRCPAARINHIARELSAMGVVRWKLGTAEQSPRENGE